MIDIKEIIIKEYTKEYRALVENLIEDEFVKSDVLMCLDEFEKFGIVAMEDNAIVAVAVFTGVDKKTSFTLYVKPSKRKEGIGSKLLLDLEEKMRSFGVEEVICDYLKNEKERNFILNRGYSPLLISNYMIYSGCRVYYGEHEIISYEDKYYEQSQKVISSSFHRMRLSLGLKSQEDLQSEEDKQWYRNNAEKIFLLRNKEEIIAVSILGDMEIDAVAVKIKEQGKGYGKAIVGYSINELLNKGTQISLWVVEGNPAKGLYEKLGFKTERIHEFVIKNIKKE